MNNIIKPIFDTVQYSTLTDQESECAACMILKPSLNISPSTRNKTAQMRMMFVIVLEDSANMSNGCH